MKKTKGTIKQGVLGMLTMKTSRKYKPLVIPRNDEEAIRLLAPEQVKEMQRIAESKNPYAKKVERDLRRYYNRLANIANKKVKEARRRGQSGGGLDYIDLSIEQDYGKGALFPTGMKGSSLNLAKIVYNIQDIQIFGESEEFDLDRLEKGDKEILDRFQKKGMPIPAGQEKEFVEFVKSGGGR